MAQLKSRIFSIANGKPLNTAQLKLIGKINQLTARDTSNLDTDLTDSYASRIFSDIAVVDFSNVYKAGPDSEMTKTEQQEFEAAKKAAIANLAHIEFLDKGKTWVILASTPSEKKQGKNILVLKEERNLLNEDLGLTDELLNGTSYAKCEDKLIPNCFSGQHEGSIAAAGLGMKNIFILASRCKGTFYRHSVEAHNLQNLTQEGEIDGNVYDGTLENKVGDAQGMIIREALPEYRNAFISIAQGILPEAAAEMAAGNVVEAIKLAYWNGKLDKIEAKIRRLAEAGSLDLYWMEQVRGKGLKATIVDAPVVKWAIENNINAIDSYFGEVATIAQLIRENRIVLITEDCLKAKTLWDSPEKWNAWIQKGYKHIWVCDNGHVSCRKGESKNQIRTSRQHLCPIVGAHAEEMANIAARTVEKLTEIYNEGSEETKALKKIFGDNFGTTVVSSYLDTAEMIAIRNKAEQGKVAAPGTWGMIQWDVKPMLAVAAHLDNEDDREALIAQMRTIFGDTIILNAKSNKRVGAMGRFPSLGMNLVFVKITRNYDLCGNAIFMSWDLLANDILKADTDGDHCIVYLPESEEEADSILAYMG